MTDLKTRLNELRSIDFTALSYDAIQTELLEYLRIASSNNGLIDDYAAGDAAKVIIDLFSYIGDMLAFRIDTLSNETYLSTAQRRQSIINLLELVAQRPKNPTAAQIQLVAIPSIISQSPITISSRFGIDVSGTDGNPVRFEVMNSPTDYYSPVVIPAGVSNFNITAFSGRYATYSTVSTGEPNIKIILPEFPVIEDSVLVSVTPVVSELLTSSIIVSSRVTEVETLIDSTEEIIYRLQYDEDGRAILTFASENFGKIPPRNHTIHVDYRIGGGRNSNISVGTIQTSATFPNVAGTMVNVTMANPDTFAVNGEDQEELESVRLRTPGLVRANENLVTTEDYKALILGIPAVQDVFVVDAYQDINVYNSRFGVPDNSCFIWVLPNTGGEISPDLRQIIAIEIETKRLTAIENFVFNPVYVDWSLTASIQVVSTKDANEVRQAVIDKLLETFGRETAIFSGKVRISKIISAIQSVDGVDYVNLSTPSADIVGAENEVLRLLESNIVLNITQ